MLIFYFEKKELIKESVCANFTLTASNGKVYIVKYYNLDTILSIGYKIKSTRENIFRLLANSILNQYLFNGQVINENKCLVHNNNIIKINN